MRPAPAKSAQCAIYTRKSTEHGLELEFNSLDAQREACEAYIKSQAHEGWKALPQRYDDPAYSGGSLERPALQQLLKDIEAGGIDVIVVYKIDRLTRSLADFAKLVEIFDTKSVSFVAVTQQFNTTTSMGRLTLNVLLSFAQFERELSSERVRDKVAASRKKGKWMGGIVPFGYSTKDKKLIVNRDEAKTVRFIYERYLELQSLQTLIADLDKNNIVARKQVLKRGEVVGGTRFTYGPLAYLLKNRIYAGETGHKGHWFAGEHEAIVDRSLFDEVQSLIKKNSIQRKQKRSENRALLTRILFDDRGNRLSPSYTTKRGVRYRFYVNSAILTGRSDQAGSVRRISAAELEAAVSDELRGLLKQSDTVISDQHLIAKYVDQVVLKRETIEITLKAENRSDLNSMSDVINIPWQYPRKAPMAKIETDQCKLSNEPDPRLVQAVARSHAWLDMLSAEKFKSVEDLAASIKMDPRSVRNGLRLAFLAPDLVEGIFTGRPLNLSNLAEVEAALSLSWKEQRTSLILRGVA